MSPLEQEAWERGLSGKVGVGGWGLQEGWTVLTELRGGQRDAQWVSPGGLSLAWGCLPQGELSA